MIEELDYLLKIVIIGDSGVGKTNILKRYTDDVFEKHTKNTIGVDFYSVDMTIHSRSIKVQFWDTAGQEQYKAMSRAYY